MKRLDWLSLWDSLRNEISKLESQTSYGKNELLDLMDRLEREMIRKAEMEKGEA